MPVYSYKERFVPLVLEWSKRQTVRGRRKHPPKVGQTAYNFFGMRTKQCRKLNESEIVKVQSISITEAHGIILYPILGKIDYEIAKEDPINPLLYDSQILSIADCDVFAWNDGFRPGPSYGCCQGSYNLMLRFWNQTHTLPFVGDVIYW